MAGRVVVSVLLSVACMSAFAVAADKVQVNLYDEAMCQGCASFVEEDLNNLYNAKGLLDIADIMIYPFGNAQVDDQGNITCQHGEDECTSNVYQTCVIHHYPDVKQWFPFILCHEQAGGYPSNAQTCLSKLGLDVTTIENCVNSDEGHKLELEMGKATAALDPPHEYTPWITVNGKPLGMSDDLLETVCKAWTGDQPAGCANRYRQSSNGKSVCPVSADIVA